MLREVRDHVGRPGVRTRQLTRGTTRREAHGYGVADRAEFDRRRWHVATARAPRKTTLPMAVGPGQPGPGGRKAWTRLALVSNRVRRGMGPAAGRQPIGGERSSVLAARRWRSAPRPGVP